MKSAIIASLTAASLAFVAVAVAQTPADAPAFMKARHARFHDIGKAMKGVSEQLKSPSPSVPDIQAGAKVIDTLAPQVITWFPRGTGPEVGIKTGARAEIWQRPDEFRKDAADFAAAAHRFNAAAQGGDVAAIKAAYPALGGACKTCHDSFRQKDD